MKTNTITISQVENLLKDLELKLTNQMNKEIMVRVKDEVSRYFDPNNKETEDEIII